MNLRLQRGAIASLVVLGLLFVPSSGFGEDTPYDLRFDGRAVAVESVGSVAALGVALLIDTPERCRWCDATRLDRGMRDALRLGGDASERAARASDWIVYGAVPIGLIGAVGGSAMLEGNTRVLAEDAVIVANAMLMNIAVTSLTKRLVARQRPYAWAADSPDANDRERHLSFFSGHTSTAFAAAASGTTIAYLRGYRAAPWIAAGGVGLATTAGYLRIAADRHWSTDVVVGAAVGSAIGAGMPILLHGRASAPDDASGGAAIVVLPTQHPQLLLHVPLP